MGMSDSREKLGQIVVIYGYRSKEISWKDFDDRTVYRTSGLIVEHNNNKFIMTTRTKLISCETIVMYHSYFDGDEPVMQQKLSIVFQSIKHNIIILSSEGKNELDLSSSHIIYGNYEPHLVCPSYTINDNNIIIPTKRSQYFIAIMNMDINSNIIEYTTKIIRVRYVNYEIYEHSYLPDKTLFVFKCVNRITPKSKLSDNSNILDSSVASELELTGVCGGIIFNVKHKPIGIVSMTYDQKIFVLPIKYLKKTFNDYYNYRNTPKLYHTSIMMPFICDIDKNNNIKIVLDNVVDTTNGKIILKKNDIVTHINSQPIKFINDQHVIFDKDYQHYITVNAYLEMILSLNHPTKISFQRKKNKITHFSLSIYSVKNKIGIPWTNQSDYNPGVLIPYLVVQDVVIVQLTHELIDIMISYNITIENELLEQILENKYDQINKIFIIIDCMNNNLAKEHHLPQIVTLDSKQSIKCPIITTINDKIVKNFNEINKIVKNNTNISLKIKLAQDKSKIIFL